MIARVSLEIALRKEFDYLIPPGLAGQIEVGSRVQVPFGPRKIFGTVTALAEESAHANLKPILKVIGAQTLVTPKVLKLARWIADYYCCAPETALKSVLPEAVRKEEDGWKETIVRPRAAGRAANFPNCRNASRKSGTSSRNGANCCWPELLELAETTAATVRKLEDRGLVEITPEISERDPYAREHILPTQPLPLNPAQATALEEITKAMDGCGSTRVPRVEAGVAPGSRPATKSAPISEPTARKRNLPHFEIPGFTYHVTWQTHNKLVLSPEARAKTLEACHFWHGKKIKCYAACVMPDHVHLLIQPLPVQETGKKVCIRSRKFCTASNPFPRTK